MNNTLPLTKLIRVLATTCLALASVARAVNPPPDGGYPNYNTAEGEDALFSVDTASESTAVGYHALSSLDEADWKR